jgi:HK97 family phage portal protein
LIVALLDRIAAATEPRADISRADPISMEEFSYLLGAGNGNAVRTKSGSTVGPHRVLGITAWYSGCRYLTESVAGLPWHHYLRIDDMMRERRAPQPWLEHPDVDWTWYGLVEHWMMAMLHKGNTFSFKLRNPVGQVIGLREIHPDRVTTGIAPDGSKRFMVGNEEYVYTTHDILHIAGMAYDCRFGINPIYTLSDSLGAVAAADDYSGRFFASGTHLGGIISVPQQLNTTQATELRNEWDSFHQGLLNAHKTGVLSKGAVYNRISLNAQETQLLESRQYGIAEISRALRIPPHKLYDLTRATFSNIEDQNIDAITDSVRPWVQRIENAINADPELVLSGHFIEASMEGLLRGDSAARSAFYTAGVTGGWMMPATPARLENLPAPAELEYYLRPLNMAVIRPGQPEEVPAPPPLKELQPPAPKALNAGAAA